MEDEVDLVGDDATIDVLLRSAVHVSAVGAGSFSACDSDCDCFQLACRCVSIDEAEAADESLQKDLWPKVSPKPSEDGRYCSSADAER